MWFCNFAAVFVCEQLFEDEFVTITYDPPDCENPGCVATYSCRNNLLLAVDNPNRTCLESGQWTDEPTCISEYILPMDFA